MATKFSIAVLLATCLLAAAADAAPPAGRWQLEPAAGFLRVLAFRGGMLGKLGHNHVISHPAAVGCARTGNAPGDLAVRLSLPVEDLVVDDADARLAEGPNFPVPVPDDDVAATRRNMLGQRLLDAGRNPEIGLASRAVRGDWAGLEIDFDVRIAGREVRVTLPATVSHDGIHVTARGTRAVSHEALGLKPFTAALGTLRVADELLLRYELRFTPVADGSAVSDCERALAVVDDDGVAVADDRAE